MAITDDTLRLMRRLRREINGMVDEQIRDMARMWAQAWSEFTPELLAAMLAAVDEDGNINRDAMRKSIRLRRVLELLAQRLDELVADSTDRILADLLPAINAAGAAQAGVAASQLPLESDLLDLQAWARINPRAIDLISLRITEQITSTALPISRETADAIRIELLKGVAQGANPRVVAQRMLRRAEYRFTGGLNRAMVISRTEMLDAHRGGAALGRHQFADVLKGWRWVCALDLRTCRSCWAHHGELHSLEEPGPLDHPQGRCDAVPETKTWAELGISAAEPPSLLRTGAEVFAQLTDAEKRHILGPTGYAAYVAGDFPMSEWSVRRSSSGWRDSYTAAPVPDQRKSA